MVLLHSRVMYPRAYLLGLLLLDAACGRIGFGDTAEEAGDGGADSPALSIEDGLVAWYPCDDDPKLGLRDATAHGYTGTCIGACPLVVESSCRFFGKGYIQAPIGDAQVVDGFTIALWTRPSVPRGTLAADASRRSWSLGFSADECGVGAIALAADGVHTCLDPPHLSTTAWTHLAGVWDGTTTRIYVDGVNRLTRAGRMIPDQGPVVFGGRGGELQFAGDLDEVRVYRRPLTAREVRFLVEETGLGRGP
jgi:Concanavalin A-like lectin/glucanases superfamily